PTLVGAWLLLQQLQGGRFVRRVAARRLAQAGMLFLLSPCDAVVGLGDILLLLAGVVLLLVLQLVRLEVEGRLDAAVGIRLELFARRVARGAPRHVFRLRRVLPSQTARKLGP